MWRLQAATALALADIGLPQRNSDTTGTVAVDWLSFNSVTAASGNGPRVGVHGGTQGVCARAAECVRLCVCAAVCVAVAVRVSLTSRWMPGALGNEGPLSLPRRDREAYTAAFHSQRAGSWLKHGRRALGEAASKLRECVCDCCVLCVVCCVLCVVCCVLCVVCCVL